MIIPTLCQSYRQIPWYFSTKPVHSSSEARYDGSEIVLMLHSLSLHHNQSQYSPCARCPSPLNYDVTCQTIHGSITSWNWKLGTDVNFTNWLQHNCGKKTTIETTWSIWSKPLFTPCVALDHTRPRSVAAGNRHSHATLGIMGNHRKVVLYHNNVDFTATRGQRVKATTV